MSRPRSRLAHVDHDTINQLRSLFGTVKNAHEKLGLQLDVPYMTFYRAMQFIPITEEQKAAILERWTIWRRWHMKDEVPVNDPMSLNPMDNTLEPEWMDSQQSTKPSKSPTPSESKSPGRSPRPQSRSASRSS